MALQHHAQFAAGVALEPFDIAVGRADRGQHLARQRQQAFARRREAQPLARAVEQRQAVVRFDRLDLVRQR
ncbi:hypothetical protein D3C87_2177380 [compost metagenome]